MTPFISSLLLSAFTIFLFMTLGFLWSIIRKRNDVADTLWGFGFILVAIVTYASNGFYYERQSLVIVLVSLWGLRLALHIYLRNRHKPEDHRYEEIKKKWKGNFYLNSYINIFLAQGFLLLLISIPVIFINSSPAAGLTVLDYIGVGIWITGFFFETIGDYQLSQFIKDSRNKGHVMQSGLWRYTRHPNYFGEVAQWWGIFILALSIPFGFLTIIGPLVITIFITKVSGIPLLEKKYAGRQEFEAYKKKTSVFFPLPQKKS